MVKAWVCKTYILSSNLSYAFICSLSQAVKTLAFHVRNMGSTPVGSKIIKWVGSSVGSSKGLKIPVSVVQVHSNPIMGQ